MSKTEQQQAMDKLEENAQLIQATYCVTQMDIVMCVGWYQAYMLDVTSFPLLQYVMVMHQLQVFKAQK